MSLEGALSSISSTCIASAATAFAYSYTRTRYAALDSLLGMKGTSSRSIDRSCYSEPLGRSRHARNRVAEVVQHLSAEGVVVAVLYELAQVQRGGSWSSSCRSLHGVFTVSSPLFCQHHHPVAEEQIGCILWCVHNS